MSTPEQKTEAATPRRRQEARREGMVLQAPGVSRALSIAGLLLIATMLLSSGQALYRSLVAQVAHPALVPVPTVGWAAGEMQAIIVTTLQESAPYLVLALGLAVVAPIVQHGLAMQPMKFEFARIDPMKGFGRIFSRRSLMQTLLAAITLILALPLSGLLWWELVRHLFTGVYPLTSLLAIVVSGGRSIGYALVAVAVLAGAVDYLIARQQFEQDIRMTRQELREEQRRSEGDPLVRSRLRSLQRRAARARMISRVKDADVVIVNPTHFAVALRYDAPTMKAPEVLAKGRGFIAERIREEAQRHGVAIVPNEPLAQALHRSVEVGHPIPPELFQAVAEVLAFVYRQQGKVPGGGGA